jgi:hypothetical protein
MPLYEVIVENGHGREVRLTDAALAVGDLVEIANQTYRVERAVAPSRTDAELRYLLLPAGAKDRRTDQTGLWPTTS